jgi:hypothetical protein
MAILPRYRRLGVEAAAPQRIDYSPLAQEGARLGNAISSNVDRMSDFVYREQARRAEMAGQEAVREQGALPILQRLSEQGGPGISIAEQSAYEAANRLAVAEIQFEAENQIAAILESAEQSGTGFTTVTAQLEDVVDGFSASLGYLNPVAAGELQLRLQGATQRASRQYASAYRARARAAATVRRTEAADNLEVNILAAARMEGSTPEELRAVVEAGAQSLADSGMTQSAVERWTESTYGEAVRENTLFRGMTMPIDELGALVESGATDPTPLPGMTLAETLTERNRLSTLYNSRRSAYESDARDLASRIDDSYTVLSAGGYIGPEAQADIVAEAERLAIVAPELSAAAERLIDDQRYISMLRGLNPAELEAERLARSGGVPGVGEPGLDTPREVARLQIVEEVIRTTEAARLRAQELALEAAEPDFTRLENALEILGVAFQDLSVGPERVDFALNQALQAAESIPASLRTDEINDALVEVQQIRAAMDRWRDASPEELSAEAERLRTEIPSQENLPEGVTVAEAILMQQGQAQIIDQLIRTKADDLRQETAAALEAAEPDFARLEDAGAILDAQFRDLRPNPAIVEVALNEISEAYAAIPASLRTDDMDDAVIEVQQMKAALDEWRDALPAELSAEMERLRTQVPREEDLPEGVTVVEAILMQQRQLSLLSAFAGAQREALGSGNAIEWARSQQEMIEDPVTGTARLVGEPIDLTFADPAATVASIDARFRELSFVETRYGAPGQNVLLPQEAAALQSMLETAQPGQQAVILATIAELGQDRALRVFSSMDFNQPESRLYAHIGSMMVTGSPRAATMALEGMGLESPPALSGNAVGTEFRSITGAAFIHAHGTRATIQETADLIYRALAARDRSGADIFQTSMYDRALDMAMGPLTLEQVNGYPALLERENLNVDFIEEWLADPVANEGLVRNRSDLGIVNFDAIRGGDYYPILAGDDAYYLATGEGATLAYWKDDRGNPILVSLLGVQSMMRYRGAE